jgi:hypothetical protein
MHISDEAVEAMKAVFDGKPPRGMRAAIYAAAPHLMAQAWDEGQQHRDEYGWSEHNPYREALEAAAKFEAEGASDGA